MSYKVKIFKLFALLPLCICLILSFCVSSFADELSTNVKGYSVLSSGGLGFGHAALIQGSSLKDNSGREQANSIIEVHSYSKPIHDSTYSEFLNDSNFIGYYCPKSKMSDSQRNQVISTAKLLKTYSDNKDIKYMCSGQMDSSGYAVTSFYGESHVQVIKPNNVKRLRCDGFVEYCYEFNNIRISGPDSCWNIAIAYNANQSWHNDLLTVISPKIQAFTYMNSMIGDLDADGKVTSADARTALRLSLKLDVGTDYQKYVADVNDDGKIQSSDANLILKHATNSPTQRFDKDINIRNRNINNSNNYSLNTLKALQSEALDWII